MDQLQEYKASEILCVVDDDGELGSGSFGTVRSGKHPVLGDIALKCFAVPGGGRKKDVLEKKIKNEYNVLQQANHEHIARLFGWSKWPNSMALVMQLMPGGNLHDFIIDVKNEVGPLIKLRLNAETADGIAFIHNLNPKKHMVHGDLKPENVLLTADLHVKISDFGSAEFRSATGTTTSTSSTSRNCNPEFTLVYAAPERLANLNARPRKEHDIYSYALIMHMVLSEEEPVRYDAAAFLEAVKQGQRPDISTIDEYKAGLNSEKHVLIIDRLVQVMQNCWKHLPQDRPEMLQVRDCLQNLLIEQKDTDVVGEVQTVLEDFVFFKPSPHHRFATLSTFSTKSLDFTQVVSTNQDAQKIEAEPMQSTIGGSDHDVNSTSDSSSDESSLNEETSAAANVNSNLQNLGASFSSMAGINRIASIPSISVTAGTLINSPVGAQDVLYGDVAIKATKKVISDVEQNEIVIVYLAVLVQDS